MAMFNSFVYVYQRVNPTKPAIEPNPIGLACISLCLAAPNSAYFLGPQRKW